MSIIQENKPNLGTELTCDFFSDGAWTVKNDAVPNELPLAVYINGQQTMTVLCTPAKLNCLAIGFLFAERIIDGPADIAAMRVCQDDALVDVKLKKEYTPPARRMITSGCGGGTSFKTTEQPVLSDLKVAPDQLLELMKQMNRHQELFQTSGGVHCSALCSPEEIIVLAEDIGRHNTLDKIAGECLLRKIEMRDRILITTGRITSEMLLKAARMQTPVVVSRGAATDRCVAMGRELGITVVAYARGSRLSVYSREERVIRNNISSAK